MGYTRNSFDCKSRGSSVGKSIDLLTGGPNVGRIVMALIFGIGIRGSNPAVAWMLVAVLVSLALVSRTTAFET